MSAFLFLLLLKNALAQALPSADVDQVQPAEPDSAGLLTDVDPALRVELRRRLLALSLPGEEAERRYRLVEGLADQDLAYFLAHEGESDPVLLRQILVQVERLLAENPSHPNAPDAAWLAARIRDDLGDTSEEPFLRVALSWPTSPYAARAWSHLGDLRIAAWEPVWRAADPGFPAMPLWDQAWEAYRAAWPDEDAGREEHAAVQLTQLAVAVGKPELALPFLLATVDRYGREHPGVLHQNQELVVNLALAEHARGRVRGALADAEATGRRLGDPKFAAALTLHLAATYESKDEAWRTARYLYRVLLRSAPDDFYARHALVGLVEQELNLAEAYDPAPTLALVQHCQTRPPPPQDAAWMEAELRSLVHSHAEVLGGQLPLSDQSWPRLDLILSAVQAWQHCSAPLGSPSGAASLYFAAGRVAYWRGASDQALVYFRLARSRATEPFAQQVSIWALDAAAKAAGYTNADHMPDGPVDLAPAQQELLAEVETFLGLYPEDPEAPQAHFVGILTLSNHGQWDRSFAAIQRLVLAWPHSLQAVQALELLSRINTRPQALEVVQARVAWALEFTRQYLPEQSAVWAEDQHLVEYQILERDAAAAYQANNYALSISLRERLLAHGAPPEAMALHRARLGEELLRVGRLSEALPHLEQAGQPEALLLAARIVVATGDLAAAQRLDARLDGATAGRMWLELLRGRPDEARLRGLLKSSDRSVALCAQLRLLRLDAEAGRLDEAVLRRAERRADLLLGQDSDATVQQELAELYVAEITYLIRKVENPSSSLPKELVAELGGYRQRVEGRINEVIAHPLRVGPWMGAVLAQADRPWDLTAALFRNTPAPSRLSEDERAHYEEGAKNVALQMELAAAERRMQVPVVLAELPVEDRLFLLEVEAMLQRSEARPVHAALQVVPPPVAAWEGPDFANDVSSVGARRELLKNLEPGAALLVARLWEDPLEIGDAAWSLGRGVEAQLAWREVAENEALRPQAGRRLGVLALRSGDVEAAAFWLPPLDESTDFDGMMAYSLLEGEEAEEWLLPLAAVIPEEHVPRLRDLRAWIFMDAGHFEQAHRLLADAQPDDPMRRVLDSRIAGVLQEEERRRRVEEEAQRAAAERAAALEEATTLCAQPAARDPEGIYLPFCNEILENPEAEDLVEKVEFLRDSLQSLSTAASNQDVQ